MEIKKIVVCFIVTLTAAIVLDYVSETFSPKENTESIREHEIQLIDRYR